MTTTLPTPLAGSGRSRGVPGPAARHPPRSHRGADGGPTPPPVADPGAGRPAGRHGGRLPVGPERLGVRQHFYAAAVQAGTKSWKAFFFGSIDSSNFITVDKPPAVAVGDGAVRAGCSASAAGACSSRRRSREWPPSALVYAAVKRWFGPGGRPGRRGGAGRTPVAALMFRFNNPDALLVLLLVGRRLLPDPGPRAGGHPVAGGPGALLGFAFLAKMLQAFIVVPAFALVYLLAAPTSLRRRRWPAALAGRPSSCSAGWWVATVALWPAGSRPLIDGSPDNSILNLIFGYNGLRPALRSGGGAGGGAGRSFSGATGLLPPVQRPHGRAGLVAVARRPDRPGRRRRRPVAGAADRPDPGRLPAVGRLADGDRRRVQLQQRRDPHLLHRRPGPGRRRPVRHGRRPVLAAPGPSPARLVAGSAVLGTSLWAFELLGRTPGYVPWLRWAVVTAGLASAVLVLAAPATPRLAGRMTGAAVAARRGGRVERTGGLHGHHDRHPAHREHPLGRSGRRRVDRRRRPRAAGGPARRRGPGVPRPPRARAVPPAASRADALRPVADRGRRPPVREAHRRAGRSRQSGRVRRRVDRSAPTAAGRLAAGPGPADRAVAGAPWTPRSTRALREDAASYRWVAATFGSTTAASLELASGEPVMAIGGFNGQGGNISLATFEAYVARGEIHLRLWPRAPAKAARAVPPPPTPPSPPGSSPTSPT